MVQIGNDICGTKIMGQSASLPGATCQGEHLMFGDYHMAGFRRIHKYYYANELPRIVQQIERAVVSVRRPKRVTCRISSSVITTCRTKMGRQKLSDKNFEAYC